MPGACGSLPHPRGVPQANSPAARRTGSWDLSTEYLLQKAQEWHEEYRSSLVVVAVEIWAKKTVGEACFSAGVLAGLLESIGGTVVGLMKTLYRLNELETSAAIGLARVAKTFVLAEIYDREHLKTPVAQDPMFNEMVRRLFKDTELKEAHDRKAKIIEEVKKIALNAPKIIEQLRAKIGPGLMKIVNGYPERWNRFIALSRQGTMESLYRAGEVFGSLLFDVIMLVLAIVGGAEVLGARISAMFPEVAAAAEAIRVEEGSAAASEGLADVDELAQTVSETPKTPKAPKAAPEPEVVEPANVKTPTPDTPAPRSLTNIQTRDWYHAKLKEIDGVEATMRAEGKSSKEIFETVTKMRNDAKLQARDLMQDQDLAKSLPPPKSPDEVLAKYDGDYEKAIQASKRTNVEVDTAIEKNRQSGEQ